MVAVHGPVAAHEAHEFARRVRLGHFGEHVLHESFAALGIGVAAVEEAVDVDLFKARALGKAQERVHVAVEAVHAAVGEKPHDVQGAALFLTVGDEGLHLGVFGDRAVGDGAVDLDEVLIEDAARADVEVAHFGIAHLAFGQAHVLAVGAKLGVRILRREFAEAPRLDAADHVGLVAAADAPAVENHQQNLLARTGRHRLVSLNLSIELPRGDLFVLRIADLDGRFLERLLDLAVKHGLDEFAHGLAAVGGGMNQIVVKGRIDGHLEGDVVGVFCHWNSL